MERLRDHARQRWLSVGQRHYPPWDPRTDPRDLVAEARDEVADVHNYALMLEHKLNCWRSHSHSLSWRLAVVRLAARVAWWALGSAAGWPLAVRGRPPITPWTEYVPVEPVEALDEPAGDAGEASQ